MRAVYANPPDAAEFAVWRAWLRPGDLFLDAGANVGLYSLLASEMGAQVVAIEPDAAALERLRANVHLNQYEVEVVPSAVGATTGKIRFSQGEDVYGHVLDAGGVEVTITTLDSLLGDRYAAGVKIDVEGFERPVVEGLENALRESRVGLLQLEWNAASERRHGEGRGQLLELLADHGYELFVPTPEGRLTRLTGTPPGANVFAARPDAVPSLVAP
jgi:FkbM family methyltransferase